MSFNFNEQHHAKVTELPNWNDPTTVDAIVGAGRWGWGWTLLLGLNPGVYQTPDGRLWLDRRAPVITPRNGQQDTNEYALVCSLDNDDLAVWIPQAMYRQIQTRAADDHEHMLYRYPLNAVFASRPDWVP